MNRNDNFVKNANLKKPTSLKQGTGGCNPCFRPPNEAAKADLIEMHQEDMRLRRSHQRARKSDFTPTARSSIATGNRHGGQHRHEREIARRARQSAA